MLTNDDLRNIQMVATVLDRKFNDHCLNHIMEKDYVHLQYANIPAEMFDEYLVILLFPPWSPGSGIETVTTTNRHGVTYEIKYNHL